MTDKPLVTITVYPRGGPAGGYRAVIDRPGINDTVAYDDSRIARLLASIGVEIATALGEED